MIPVYVNVFNRYQTTRTLCEQVANLRNATPVIVDNNSDWQPLLDWYMDCPFEVIRLRDNLGHHAPWKAGVTKIDNAPFYVVTDCDLDIDGVPADVLEVLQRPFLWHRTALVKSGLGLRIDDLPEWQTEVKEWESQFWRRRISGEPLFYDAMIDTTFAMYQQSTPPAVAMRVGPDNAVRTGEPYVARHMPWYLDGDNLDEENRHYFETAGKSNSWKPKGRGLSAHPLRRA